MANLKTIQFLRNADLYASLKAAKSALQTKAATCLDGSPIAGRYTVQTGATTADTETRTILGIVANGTVSFFMNDKEIDNVLDGLDFGPIGGTDASVLTQIQQVDGKISGLTANVGTLKLTGYEKGSSSGAVEATDSVNVGIGKLEKRIDGEVAAINATIDGLDASSVADDNKVVTDVTQEAGQITATAANITGVKLAGYQEAAATGDVATTDTLGEALGKLQKTIHEMDKAADVVAGQVVTTVSEADGVVSETKANVKDLQLGGYARTNDTGAIASADTINVALSKIENQIGANTVTAKDKSIVVETTGTTTEVGLNIRSGERVLKLDTDATTGGVYTDLNVVKITSDLPAEIKERYELRDSSNVKIGESIDIAKDSHIVSITYISDPADPKYQNLEYKYIDVSGNTQTEYVDVSSLVIEAEFASGVTVTNHVAHGVVDPTSESFLTVGADGFKLAGVADAISTAVNALDADKSGSTTHVGVRVEEVDGKITAVTVSEDDIASAQGLADEITARGNADTELSNRLGTGVTSDNTATAQFAALSGNGSSTSAETSVEGAKRYADAKLDDVVGGLDADVSGNSTHVTVGVVEEDGVITAVTVSEDNIANADDLAGLSAKTVTAITSTNGSITASIDDAVGNKSYDLTTDTSKIKLSGYTESSATTEQAPANGDTISEALAKIYATAKHHHASGSNAIDVTTDTSGSTISLILDDSSSLSTNNNDEDVNNALMITSDGLFLSKDWDCGTF
jgi:hypothetical protein